MAKAIPDGYHTATPYLTVKGAAKAIEFYKQAFGAQEVTRMPGPDGQSLMHAEIKIGDSHIFLSDEFPGMAAKSPHTVGAVTASVHLYVEEVDAFFSKALAAGAQVRMPVMDMFWGDRYGRLVDPFGQEWGIATHKEDLSIKELQQRSQAFNAEMAKKQGA